MFQSTPPPPDALSRLPSSERGLLPEYKKAPPRARRRASWRLIVWLQLLSAARTTLSSSRPPVRVTAGSHREHWCSRYLVDDPRIIGEPHLRLEARYLV